MSDRKSIDDEKLEQIVGGMFAFNGNTMTLTYTHADGSVTTHRILDYRNAWTMSNDLHGQNVPEDAILAKMIAAGYIAG